MTTTSITALERQQLNSFKENQKRAGNARILSEGASEENKNKRIISDLVNTSLPLSISEQQFYKNIEQSAYAKYLDNIFNPNGDSDAGFETLQGRVSSNEWQREAGEKLSLIQERIEKLVNDLDELSGLTA